MTKRTASRSAWFSEDLTHSRSSIPLLTRLSHGWYRLTAVADTPAHASFQVRETSRLSRFLSSIVGCLLFIFLGFLPACLDLANQYVLVADATMLPICLLALLLGKQGKVTAVCPLLTLCFEVALTIVIVTTHPFDEASIQQYELFVFGELFAVSCSQRAVCSPLPAITA